LSTPTGRCYFSFKVLLHKTTLFASAPGNDDLYWFERSSGTWDLMRRTRPISAPDFVVGNWLAMSPGLLLASGASAGGNVGAAYLFYQHHPTRGRGWGLVATLLPEHSRSGTGFGQPVALGFRVAAVGASLDSLRGDEAGAAYIYDLHFAHTPRFESTPLYPVEVHVGELFEYAIVVTDADGEAVQLTAPTLPAWLRLTTASDGTGTLAGTPPASAVGPHPVTLRAIDVTGKQVEQSFVIRVLAAGSVPPPVPMSGRGCACSTPGTRRDASMAMGFGLSALLLLAGLRLRRDR
jgi:MYXO-CTERM domain-containing protein